MYLSAHILNHKETNQNAVWNFSGLAYAKRWRWHSLLESECFYSESDREVFPPSLTFRKAGNSYCGDN